MAAATVTVPLSEPLITHKGELKSIELKTPTARSFRIHGEPFKTNVTGDRIMFEINNENMFGFLADMTGHDQIVLDALPAADYIKLRNEARDLIIGIAGDHPTNG